MSGSGYCWSLSLWWSEGAFDHFGFTLALLPGPTMPGGRLRECPPSRLRRLSSFISLRQPPGIVGPPACRRAKVEYRRVSGSGSPGALRSEIKGEGRQSRPGGHSRSRAPGLADPARCQQQKAVTRLPTSTSVSLHRATAIRSWHRYPTWHACPRCPGCAWSAGRCGPAG